MSSSLGSDLIQEYLNIETSKEEWSELKGWRIQKSDDAVCSWFHFEYVLKELPFQGVKLHISASTSSAIHVLQNVLFILQEEHVWFKCISTIASFKNIQNGKGGLHQVGKFITVYPYDDSQAISLGQKLDTATKGLIGPRIIGERSLNPESLVHYRYGAYQKLSLQLDNGQIVNAIYDLKGELVQDERGKPNFEYSKRGDPFRSRGFKTTENSFEQLLKSRFIRLRKVHESPKGTTWISLDLDHPETGLVLLKEALGCVMEDNSGLDAKSRLLKEKDVLVNIQDLNFCPKIVDFWEEESSAFLAYKFKDGVSLKKLILDLSSQGLSIDNENILRWTEELASMVLALHKRSIALGDLKPDNILVDSEGFLHLIDFELSKGTKEVNSFDMGTNGYCAFFVESINILTMEKCDIYSFGATVFSMITMVDLSYCSTDIDHLKLIELINPRCWRKLVQLVDRCLNLKSTNCFTSFEEILLFLKQLNVEVINPKIELQNLDFGLLDDENLAANYLYFAKRIGDTIVEESQESECGNFWISHHPLCYGHSARDLYFGNSGVGLFLIDLFAQTGDLKYRLFAEKTANWLKNKSLTFGRSEPLAGLYFGESGVGFFFLALFQKLKDGKYLEWAAEINDLVAKTQFISPDLLTGAAGIGIFHLSMWQITHEEIYLNRAKECGKFLLQTALTFGDELWEIPSILNGKKDKAVYLGYAHGAAGIGFFLLELSYYTKEHIWLEKVKHIINCLNKYSSCSLNDDSGVNWSVSTQGIDFSLFWCHGAPGISKFLARAYELTQDNEYLNLTHRAVKTFALGGRWISATQCHGLAGNIECLLDVQKACSQESYSNELLALSKVLSARKIKKQNSYRWSSESPDIFTPDFMVGESGIGACFIRLANPILSSSISCQRFS